MNKIKTILIKQKFSFEMKTIWHKYNFNFKNIRIIKRFKAAVRIDFEDTKLPQTLQRT